MSDPRVICVKGGNSNWYEQAIFILNKNDGKKKVPIDLVAEAERIIGGYYEKPYNLTPVQTATAKAKQKSSRTFDITMNIIMLICCVTLAGVLLWNFL